MGHHKAFLKTSQHNITRTTLHEVINILYYIITLCNNLLNILFTLKDNDFLVGFANLN